MQLYLPIAEMPVNMLLMLGMGAAIGFVSGLLGVGGGFLLTPLLIFAGIPTAVAVGSGAAQVVASSSSAASSYFRRRSVDLRLALVLGSGGAIGSAIGVTVFGLLQRVGQLDLVIAVLYVTFLGIVGGLMLVESVRTIVNARRGRPTPLRPARQLQWAQNLPFKVRFRRSRLVVSVIPLIALGLGIGFLGALLGIGGGLMVVPALIYIFRVPTSMVFGTSLVQIVITMTVATVLHAVLNQTVDAILALILIIGGVIGAQFGARSAAVLRGETLRALLAILVLAVGARFLVDLVTPPVERYSISETEI
ncbi:MAG: sulfite exporter TauE/SafE family protein [Bauldia sp.]|nr:sulfite exporter TauE/SafE family protein [Bauldia sp.]